MNALIDIKVKKITLWVIIFILLFSFIYMISDFFGIVNASSPITHKRHMACADFSTWNAAQSAFKKGATYLDSNHDGIACNALHDLGK